MTLSVKMNIVKYFKYFKIPSRLIIISDEGKEKGLSRRRKTIEGIFEISVL